MTNLDRFYENVMTNGHLRTISHAKRWTDAALKITGHNMKRSARKELAKALPAELGGAVSRMFWLVKLFDANLPADEFQKQVANRAGVTDAQFARLPILAIYAELKNMLGNDNADKVRNGLPAEVAELWEIAGTGEA